MATRHRSPHPRDMLIESKNRFFFHLRQPNELIWSVPSQPKGKSDFNLFPRRSKGGNWRLHSSNLHFLLILRASWEVMNFDYEMSSCVCLLCTAIVWIQWKFHCSLHFFSRVFPLHNTHASSWQAKRSIRSSFGRFNAYFFVVAKFMRWNFSPVNWLKYVNRIHVPPHRTRRSWVRTTPFVDPARVGKMRYHKSIYGDHKNLSETWANSAESTMTKQSPFVRKCRAKTI